MNEDRLLRELGHLAKEEEGAERARLDERWDRLAAGTLTTEEEAELLALAETSPEAREAWEAFRPLGPEFQARVVEKIAAGRGRLLHFPSVRIGGWVTAAAAAAACLVVLLRSPASMPVPVYSADLSGGVQTVRGDEPAPATGQPVFIPGSMITLVVRPRTPIDGQRLDARGFLSPQTGRADLARWKPEPEFKITDRGVVRLHGKLGEEIQIARGDWTVWIVVGNR